MKKALYVIFFLVVSVLFFHVGVSAATPTPTPPPTSGEDQRWVCLDAKKTKSHEAVIKAKESEKPLPDATTYIVECLQPDGKEKICTTGKSNLDKEIFALDNLSRLKSDYDYKLEYVRPPDNPKKSDSKGNIGKIIWGDSTAKALRGIKRTWLAMNYYSPTAYNCGTQGGQQQCTFRFTQVAGNCVKLAWDPAGRVFDAKSLEPLPDAQVKLYAEKGVKNSDSYIAGREADATDINNSVKDPTLNNPRTTSTNGKYSFQVFGNRNYKLDILKDGYEFVSDLNNKLDPNYKKAYLYKIYKKDTVVTNLVGEAARLIGLKIFVPEGKEEFRDIPLMPKGQPYRADRVTVINNPVEGDSIPGTGILVVNGSFSHPFTKVCVSTKKYNIAYDTSKGAYNATDDTYDPELADKDYKCPVANSNGMFTFQGVEYPLLGTTNADNEGDYTLQINRSKLPLGEEIGRVRGEKISLTSVTVQPSIAPQTFIDLFHRFFHLKTVHAAEYVKQTTIEPVLDYIEGYAYDGVGKVIPNATVGIYLSFSNKPYYQTNADKNGYFKITSEYLPAMSYRIIYTTATGSSIVTPLSKFIIQNKEYIAKAGINPYSFVDKNGKETEFPLSRQGVGVHNSNTDPTQPGGQKVDNVSASPQNSALLLIVILILLILGVAGFMGFYLLKKKQPVV